MAYRSATGVLYQRVMEEAGFYRNGAPTSGVIEAESLRNDNQQLEKRIKYSAVIDPEQINATAVFELSGSPCIYFTQLDQSDPDPKELARLHKLSWNHGLAPMLWVVTPTSVRLYNCYSEPTQNNPESNLIALFENTEASLKQLSDHASRLQLESGEFWQWQNAKQIDRKKRVDRVLVEDLQKAEKKLRAEGLESQIAHALLMRSIFVAYLQDRGILDTQFFQSRFNVDTFTDVLDDVLATRTLFEWVQVTFNGDMFPASSNSQDFYEARHLEIVKDLVGGTTEIESGQGRLWRFYDFKVIPVELISSIYENFLYSKDSQTAEETSVHYTPVNLVDLVLDEVFKKLDGDSKVLDLACGSGLFLVESLRRLVVKRCVNGEEPSRQLVRETLYNQIYGVDIEPQAIQIAAFSLYLTTLELDQELEQQKHLSSDLKFQPLIGRNLFSCDAFDDKADFNRIEALVNKKIHAIVGNPPWTKSKFTKSASAYCKRKRIKPECLALLTFWWKWYTELQNSQSINTERFYLWFISFAYHLIYGRSEYPLAYGDPPDQAFLWRAGDFSNESTQIGLILHGRSFFSNSSEATEAKKALLERFKPRVIINLSKLYRDHLFPNSEAPAMILIAEGQRSGVRDTCYFVCPKRSLEYRKHGILEIGSEDIKKLSVHGIASDPDMLKVATWGSARDMQLIQSLRSSFSSIESVVGHAPRNGIKVGNKSGKKDKDVPQELNRKPWLPSGRMPRYQIELEDLEYFPYTKVEAPRDPEIYQGPLVIIPERVEPKGIYSAFSSSDLVYTTSYFGVPIPQNLVHLAHYLNGIINSSLASYFLFMTASSWGVERKKLMLQDLLRLPIPQPNDSNGQALARILEVERQLLKNHRSSVGNQLKRQLDEAVFDLYGLDETERILVEDSINVTIDLYMNRENSLALQRPQIPELELYAMELIGVIRPFLQTLRERVLVADVIEVSRASLQVVKFSFLPTPGREYVVQTTQAQTLKVILNQIAEQLPQQVADRIFTRRDLRIYSGQDIYIVKPAQKRYWSRSAGLNDADLILSEHLRVNRAAIR
jgi:N-6 DNA Methylase